MESGAPLAWCVIFSSVLAPIAAYTSTLGTTPNITDVLIGRCEEYRSCLQGSHCMPSYGNVKCNASVAAFMGAVRRVDPCMTPDNAFDDFLDMVPPTTDRDKTLFWSGVGGTTSVNLDVAQVSSRLSVLEETYPGYMANNLTWCGSQENAAGLNFTACPAWRSSDCPNNTMTAFWESASRRLARQAKGKTFVVLNSQRVGGAFRNISTFYRIEAPNLNSSLITNVAIYLIPDFSLSVPNDRYRETCENGTIRLLRTFLSDMGLNNTCEEDPEEIMWLQCARFPDSKLCVPYSASSTKLTPTGAVLVLGVAVMALSSTCA